MSWFVAIIIIMALLDPMIIAANAGIPKRAKFYDFQDQLIDGEIKKPSTLYTGTIERVKFDRLLRLKKSFMKDLYKTIKDSVFR